MKPMNGDFFIDSNIFLYLFDKDKRKADIAFKLLSAKPTISVQVINESINVLVKKLKFSKEKAIDTAHFLRDNSNVKSLSEDIVVMAFFIFQKYQYRYFDCVIIASALQNNCSILYSEDMQHKQVIEKKLTIVNPFI